MTATPDLKVEPLGSHHDRAGFVCGVESLDRYIKSQAGQDVKRLANGVFILVEHSEPNKILGYYTLCANSLSQGDVPVAARKHVPRYPVVRATLIGRLAISHGRQGEGLGRLLLVDALQKAYLSAATVGSSMVVVDAISEQAARFCEGNGFVRLPDTLRLILPMITIAKLF